MRWLLLLVAGCGGVSRDGAAPDIAPAAVGFGAGCYVSGREIYACSTNVRPRGERVCGREPPNDSEVHFEPADPAFERELNSHRCRIRLGEQVACAPIELRARRLTGDGLHDVSLLQATVNLTAWARAAIYNDARATITFEAVLCNERGMVAPSPTQFGHGTSPVFFDMLNALRGAATTSEGCAKYEVATSRIRCVLR